MLYLKKDSVAVGNTRIHHSNNFCAFTYCWSKGCRNLRVQVSAFLGSFKTALRTLKYEIASILTDLNEMFKIKDGGNIPVEFYEE